MNPIDRFVATVLLGGSRVWLVWFVILIVCILAQQMHPENKMLTSIVAGAMTGVVETLLMFPIENLKTQQQLAARINSNGKPVTGMSFVQAARRTWRLQGFAGFYRGMGPVLFCAVPNQALRWTSFDMFCNLFSCLDQHGGLMGVALAGIGSGIVVAIVTGVPVETAKTQAIHASMTAGSSSNSSTPSNALIIAGAPDAGEDSDIDVLEGSTILPLPSSPALNSDGDGSGALVINVPTVTHQRSLGGSMPRERDFAQHNNGNNLDINNGNKSVLRGWLPTIIKKVGNQGVRFPVHRAMLNFLCGDSHVTCDASQNPMLGFIAGATAGISSILATQPVDVVKTRMQGLDADRYGHSWSCAWHLLREEGMQVFFHGMGARALRSGLGAGFAFAFFPVVKAFLAA